MAWTYDPTDLNTSTPSGRLNTVRFLIGDTDSSDEQVQNEEITFALSEKNDNVYGAGEYIAEALAAKYARLVTTELDGQLSVDYSDIAKAYRALASDLKSKYKTDAGLLGSAGGGLSTPNAFKRYQFNNPTLPPELVKTWD
jgi:hypothetical protein